MAQIDLFKKQLLDCSNAVHISKILLNNALVKYEKLKHQIHEKYERLLFFQKLTGYFNLSLNETVSLAFFSDVGFCSSFNSNILQKCKEIQNEFLHECKEIQKEFFSIGKKNKNYGKFLSSFSDFKIVQLTQCSLFPHIYF
jgi:F0F1-type ATP synthase gamma subunit